MLWHIAEPLLGMTWMIGVEVEAGTTSQGAILGKAIRTIQCNLATTFFEITVVMYACNSFFLLLSACSCSFAIRDPSEQFTCTRTIILNGTTCMYSQHNGEN